MFWSIGSCQNRVSADQYHLTVRRAEVSTHRGRVFLKLSADKLPVSDDRRLKLIHMKYVVFMQDLFFRIFDGVLVYVTMAPHYEDFDFKLTSEAKIQPFF